MAIKTTGLSGKYFPDGSNKCEVISADATGLVSVKGIGVEVDGVTRLKFAADSATVDLVLAKGVVYPFSVSEVDITNSVASQKVYLYRYSPSGV